jgi:hypothetical protein
MRRDQKTSAEQVVLKLRQIEVQTAQGKSLAPACKEAEISEQSYHRWRKEYGGLQVDQARKMKDLERENARLRRLVADLSLEKQVLADVASGTACWPSCCSPARSTSTFTPCESGLGRWRPLRSSARRSRPRWWGLPSGA